jgi:hypothetical protein
MSGLSPAAQFLNDMAGAMNRAKAAGLEHNRMTEILADLVEDLRDLADDSQWLDTPPSRLAEARAQLDAKKDRRP